MWEDKGERLHTVTTSKRTKAYISQQTYKISHCENSCSVMVALGYLRWVKSYSASKDYDGLIKRLWTHVLVRQSFARGRSMKSDDDCNPAFWFVKETILTLVARRATGGGRTRRNLFIHSFMHLLNMHSVQHRVQQWTHKTIKWLIWNIVKTERLQLHFLHKTWLHRIPNNRQTLPRITQSVFCCQSQHSIFYHGYTH